MAPDLPGSFVILCSALAASTAMAEGPLVLRNDRHVVEVRPPHGLITRVADLQRGLELIAEPRLADNFRFTMPLRGEAAWQATEAHEILGREQTLTSHELREDALVLTWAGPLTSVTGRRCDVSVEMTIRLASEDIRFDLTIRNRSDLEIGEVFCPILGGCLGLGDTPELRRKTELVLPACAGIRRAAIFQSFANFSWLGVMGPEQFHGYPDTLSMPWMDLSHPQLGQGVYFGAHDPIARFKVLHLQMDPGIAPGRADGNWPRPEELQGLPAGVRISLVHMCYQPPRQDFQASPAVLRFHDGDWRTAAAVYGAFAAEAGNAPSPTADWLAGCQAFHECPGVPFSQLPEYARQAAAAGVKALLLTDWKIGGHADGVPRFEPDPRFGTREDLARAIRECHDLGVRIVARFDLSPANQLDGWYRDELHRYACTDRWGVPYSMVDGSPPSHLTGGFGSGQRRTWLNAGHPGMRRLLAGQARGLAGLGIDGLYLQGFFARPLDFNASTGRTPDRAVWEGGLECIADILKAGRSVHPDFSVCTDTVWDRLVGPVPTCLAEVTGSCALPKAFPSWKPALAVVDQDGCSTINEALRSGARLRIAPENRKPMGGPEMAEVAGYCAAVLALRDALRATLIDGRPLGADALRLEGGMKTGAFRSPATGRRSVVLVNPGFLPAEARLTGFTEPGEAEVVVWQPAEGACKATLPLKLTVPGRQAVVVTEEDALERLTDVPRWQAVKPAGLTVFDLTSAEDLDGWTLTGAFAVGPIRGLNPRSSLNSLCQAPEAATGTALSPSVEIRPEFDAMEILFQGGYSHREGGRETLALQIVDAESGQVLEEILPPGTHELVRHILPLNDRLRGRTVRIRLVDSNTNASFAWIGLRRVSLTTNLNP